MGKRGSCPQASTSKGPSKSTFEAGSLHYLRQCSGPPTTKSGSSLFVDLCPVMSIRHISVAPSMPLLQVEGGTSPGWAGFMALAPIRPATRSNFIVAFYHDHLYTTLSVLSVSISVPINKDLCMLWSNSSS